MKSANIFTVLFAFVDTIEARAATPLLKLLTDFGGWPVLGDNEGGFWKESEYDFESLLGRLIGTLAINGAIMSSGIATIPFENTLYVSSLLIFRLTPSIFLFRPTITLLLC